MIRVSLHPVDGDPNRYHRTVRFGTESPLTEVITLTPEMFPRHGDSFKTDLHELPSDQLRALGESLFDVALGADAGKKLRALRKKGEAQITIEEHPDNMLANCLPWELMHDGEDFVALHPRTPVIRQPEGLEPADESQIQRPLRALFFWSAPKGANRLSVEDEQIRIAAALAPYKQSAQVIDFEVLHCTREKLQAALRSRDYDLVYFTGHGTFDDGQGQLVLEDDDGGIELLSASEFARWLGIQAQPPAIVFLNCCLSAAGGDSALPGRFLDLGRRVMEEGVGQVIATLTPVYDAAAQDFLDGFLRSLLSGTCSVTRAVAEGRAAVHGNAKRPMELRQTFFQYLLLGAEPVRRREFEAGGASEANHGQVLFASLEHPSLQGREVVRNSLLDRIEQLYRGNERVAGLYGVGGLGKTVSAAQLERHLVAHPNARLRKARTLWLDLRGDDPTPGDVVKQFCGMLSIVGDSEATNHLAQMVDIQASVLSQYLVKRLGENCFLTIDNAETLLDESGRIHQAEMLDLLAALAGQTGWHVLITSRERFDIERDGRELCATRWLPIGELGLNEAAALLRTEFDRIGSNFDELGAQSRRLLFREIAHHPHELRLFLRDLDPNDDWNARIRDVHSSAAKYANLDYYIGRQSAEARRILQLLAVTDEAEPADLLQILWDELGSTQSCGELAGGVETVLNSLVGAALVESHDNYYWLLPVLRQWLTGADSDFGMTVREQDALHKELAIIFKGLAKLADDQIKELHG